jgi:hypothetical protein
VRDKRSWQRVPNAFPGKGNRVGNKYNFTQVLQHAGDFVETDPFPTMQEAMKVCYAAHIWGYRKKRKIKCYTIYHPNGFAMGIERIQ